jgi:hypothetical protein
MRRNVELRIRHYTLETALVSLTLVYYKKGKIVPVLN